MPFYLFSIHGRGDLMEGAIGFYVSRVAWGKSSREAANKVLKRLSEQWETGKYAFLKQSGIVSLEIEECSQVRFWKAWELRKTGHVFYQSDE